MRKTVLAATIGLLLAGCEKPVEHEASYRTYEVVGIHRPKHFRVDLRDVQTGVVYRKNISKHCNRWRELEMGSRWSIWTVVYHWPESDRWGTELQGTRKLCPGH